VTDVGKNTGRSLKFLKWLVGILLVLSAGFIMFVYVFLDSIVKKQIIKGVYQASEGLYALEIDHLNAEFWSGAIEMEKVWLRPNKEVLRYLRVSDTSNYIPNVNLYFDSVSISRIGWFRYLLNREKLEIGKVLISRPDFLIEGKITGATVREENRNFLELLPGIIAAFTGSLRIEEIMVRNGRLHYDLTGDQ
jgi:hypothetical protein